MSKINVTRQIANPILNALAKDVANDRKNFERQLGQVFIFEPSKIRDMLKDLAASYELKAPTPAQTKKVVETIRATLAAREATFIKAFGANKVNKIKAGIVHQLRKEDTMFIVRSFGTITRVKRNTVVSAVREAFNSANKNKSEIINSQKFGFGVTGFGGQSGLHTGHGDLGTPVAGLSVARSIAKLDKLIKTADSDRSKAKLTEIKTTITRQVNETLNVEIPYDMVITKDGKFRRSFSPILSFQDTKENLGDAVSEKRIKQIVEKTIRGIDHTFFEGSTSIAEAEAEVQFYNMIVDKHPRKKSIGTSKAAVIEKNVVKKQKKNKVRSKIKALKSNLYSTALEKRIERPSSNVSTASLIALLNQKIQAQVIANMGPPGLTNRTGRFAQSVKIIDVQFTKQGFPSIGYTYDKNPYQIFEMGKGAEPWANNDRDPRTLINRSIRELAAELVIGRFYTRRL